MIKQIMKYYNIILKLVISIANKIKLNINAKFMIHREKNLNQFCGNSHKMGI